MIIQISLLILVGIIGGYGLNKMTKPPEEGKNKNLIR